MIGTFGLETVSDQRPAGKGPLNFLSRVRLDPEGADLGIGEPNRGLSDAEDPAGGFGGRAQPTRDEVRRLDRPGMKRDAGGLNGHQPGIGLIEQNVHTAPKRRNDPACARGRSQVAERVCADASCVQCSPRVDGYEIWWFPTP